MVAVERAGGILIVTADHGNADEMYEHEADGHVKRGASGSPVVKTSHTLNPVPFAIFDPRRRDGEYRLDPQVLPEAGLAHVTATCLNLLGYVQPDDEEASLLVFP
jgi:2,3-bisphosphoglycerate-independent phosphoglycerate mutase